MPGRPTSVCAKPGTSRQGEIPAKADEDKSAALLPSQDLESAVFHERRGYSPVPKGRNPCLLLNELLPPQGLEEARRARIQRSPGSKRLVYRARELFRTGNWEFVRHSSIGWARFRGEFFVHHLLKARSGADSEKSPLY